MIYDKKLELLSKINITNCNKITIDDNSNIIVNCHTYVYCNIKSLSKLLDNIYKIDINHNKEILFYDDNNNIIDEFPLKIVKRIDLI